MISHAIKWMSPAGESGHLSIFIFHRVLQDRDPLLPWEPDGQQFDWMVGLITRAYQVLPLVEAAQRLSAGILPRSAAAITFDDGYADNYLAAMPILRKYGATATFFIATSYLDGGRMWNDDVIETARRLPAGTVDLSEFGLGLHAVSDVASRVRCYEKILSQLKYEEPIKRIAIACDLARSRGISDQSDLMMSTSQLRALRDGGMQIGAHTMTHPILQSVDDQTAMAEIASGKSRLEQVLDQVVDSFAYPNGRPGKDYADKHVEMVRAAGFVAAVSTSTELSSQNTDSLQLPRFTPWDRTPMKFGLRCLGRAFAARSRKVV